MLDHRLLLSNETLGSTTGFFCRTKPWAIHANSNLCGFVSTDDKLSMYSNQVNYRLKNFLKSTMSVMKMTLMKCTEMNRVKTVMMKVCICLNNFRLHFAAVEVTNGL